MSQPSRPLDTHAMRRVAAQLEADNPLWIVVFGAYSREFVAFPRFDTPSYAVVTVNYPGAMPDRMRAVEAWASGVRR